MPYNFLIGLCVVRADTLLLKNGVALVGVKISENETSYTVELSKSEQSITIEKQDVFRRDSQKSSLYMEVRRGTQAKEFDLKKSRQMGAKCVRKHSIQSQVPPHPDSLSIHKDTS